MKTGIAFYPFGRFDDKNCYIKSTKKILSEKHRLSAYVHGTGAISAVRRNRYLFLNWFEYYLTLTDKLILLLARVMRRKIIWTFHDALPHEDETKKAERNLYFMCRISTSIILLSRESKTELARIAKNRSDVLKKAVYIPHINYCEDYLPGKDTIERTADSPFTFLYFGNIRPYKNLELLIRTFRSFKGTNAFLIIAGSPMNAKYAKKIKSLCGDDPQIHLDFRYIPDKEVYDYMQKADAVVLPHDKRSGMNSGAMIAAFSCRKPVIISDIAMARDYADKAYVYQYHYHSAKDHGAKLSEAMHHAYSAGRDKNLALGEDAYQDVMFYNSKEVIRKRLQELLP
ncbi:MAG: glycosyltransferase family 4 protein [Lachnospiraceae bacterium]|nr:glycosyltransferase family 4 protein [Lachnospiraceae bacterium]